MNPIPVSIVISDPWDVGEALNWAPLRGQMVRVAHDECGGKALIRFEAPISYRGVLYTCAVVTPRHEGHEVMEIVAGAKLCAALTCAPEDQPRSADPFDTSGWRGGLAFIGDIVASA